MGIYKYPVLKEIDFLSEEVKGELDKYLSEIRVGNSVHSLYRRLEFSGLAVEEKKRLYDWLVVEGIFEERFAILCPSCVSHVMTIYLPVNQREKILDAFKSFRTDEQMFRVLEEITFCGCPGCESNFDFESLDVDRFKYKTVHVLIAEGGSGIVN